MNLSLLVLYAPPPTLDRAARFYGAIFDAAPVRERHGSGPEHWAIASPGTDLVVEVYPATNCLHTAARFEFRGRDINAAVERLMDHAYSSPERTRDGRGWWTNDPIGNTVVLLP